jgi:DNA-binding transcriptional MerR regulator
MKIGTFARKFKLNISAVRFYINNGLLRPDRIGGQYEFDRECVSDMEKILKYKRYYFSLEEIQLLFFMEKASRFQDEIVIEVCADILKSKRKQLITERDNLTQFIDEIDKEIESFASIASKDGSDAGVPFSFIPYLYCPVCQEALKLDSASLSNGSIQKGVLSCECGYTAVISDGIILCKDFSEETPFKAFENVESVIAMKDQFSPTYRRLITRTYIWMYNCIVNRLDNAKCFLTGPFTFNFLLEYIEKLGKNNTYIIFDPSLKRISKIKKYLSSWDYTIVFIVGKPADLPIKNSSVDFYIDDYSTVNSLFTYNTFSTETIAPLLKNAGEAVGIFTTYQNAPKSLRNFNKDHPNFKSEKMTLGGLKYNWSLVNVKTIEEKIIGTTTSGEPHFPQNEIGETIEVHGYHARKG